MEDVNGTKLVKPEDADLVWDRPLIDAYEARMIEVDPPTSFWQGMFHMVSISWCKRFDGKGTVEFNVKVNNEIHRPPPSPNFRIIGP